MRSSQGEFLWLVVEGEAEPKLAAAAATAANWGGGDPLQLWPLLKYPAAAAAAAPPAAAGEGRPSGPRPGLKLSTRPGGLHRCK